MSHAAGKEVNVAQLLAVLKNYRYRWMLPAIVITLAAATYAFVRTPTWQAAQALVVRGDAGATNQTPGKFSQPEEMRVAQETVLEIARGRSVLTAALEEVGPAADAENTANFPSAKDVEALRKAVSVTAPNGAEFGTTEIFYLNAKADDRERALRLTAAISSQLKKHFQQLVDQKAKSVTLELEKSVRLAQAELGESTAQLADLEAGVGADLADLRSMSKLSSSGISLQAAMTTLDDELREAKVAEESNATLLEMLQAAQQDSRALLAMPNTLLEKLPVLRRLKEGLVDAQLRTAELLGSMSHEHPRVRGAVANEQEVAAHILRELPVAIRSIEVERKLARIKIASIERQLADARSRMQHLAAVRAEHSQLSAQVERDTQQVRQAESRLAESRSLEAGAQAANLISLVDSPDTGTRPLGPGKAVVIGVGMIGGLLVGFAVLFLTVPTIAPTADTHATAVAVRTAMEAPATPAPTLAPQRSMPAAGQKLNLTQALSRVAAL